MEKDRIKQYLKLYDFDPDGFTCIDDCDDDHIWFDKALAVVDDAYMSENQKHWEWDGVSLQVLRDFNMELDAEGSWLGPVRYVVAWRELPEDWFNKA